LQRRQERRAGRLAGGALKLVLLALGCGLQSGPGDDHGRTRHLPANADDHDDGN
jgi:hypothetical protein